MAALIEKALEFREKAKAHEKPKLTWWKPKYRKAADDYCRAAQFHYQVNFSSLLSYELKAKESIPCS